ncbi:MAG: molybdopterin adenylyltransferase [Epsilonproteobacteria bacterium]|nr:MAG: molybdopterin adenylyltransferase [Campylobacteraceae bacterium 4484_166]RLA74182.1 MAG: molybdopterin adenylyltransferase [Campylobacterota bacterium]
MINIGIITTSDRASRGTYEDISGKAIKQCIDSFVTNDIQYYYEVIEDEQTTIEKTLLDMADNIGCDLIVTTGGTGPAKRDVTTEATLNVCEKILPGFGELMRSTSLQYVPTAILSRQTAGTRGSSLIINLPGKPKSIKECLDVVFPAVPYCIDLIGGNYINCDETKIKIFRPKSS